MKDIDFHRLHFGTGIQWTELFESEEDLLEAVKNINVQQYILRSFKGYEFINSFVMLLNQGRTLSPKQITQVKRMAKQIYMYYKGNQLEQTIKRGK